MKILEGITTGVCRLLGLVICFCWVLPCCFVALVPGIVLALAMALVHPVVEGCSRKASDKLSGILRNEIIERCRDAYRWVMELM